MVVPVMLRVEHYVKVAHVEPRHEAATYHDLVAVELQACEGAAQRVLIGAGVEKSAHNHVATDAARTVKIERASHDASFPYCVARGYAVFSSCVQPT